MKYHYSVDMDTDNSLSIILRHIKPNSRVFEFGPAEGYMTEYLKNKLNCEVYCLEIDEQAAAKAKVYCDKMIIADLNKVDWLEQIHGQFNSFDYLIFADVLEHLLKPEDVLENLSERLLKENGKVLISVPHIGHTAVILQLMEGKFEYRETGLLDRTHVTFFTRDNVNKLLDKAKLSVIEWHNVYMFPEQTELASAYSSVPLAVEEYLKNKIDAHVYQFVTISEKQQVKEPIVIEDVVIETGNYRYSDFIQLFWNTGEGFSEENSKRLPLQTEGEYHKYIFEFNTNEVPLTSMRLDPTNFPCFAQIRSLKIWGFNIILNSFEEIESGSFVAVHGLEIERETEGLNIFSYNGDPQLQEDFASGTMDNYRLFRVQVEFSYESRLKPHLLYKTQKRIDDLKVSDTLEKMEHNYSLLKAEISKTNYLTTDQLNTQKNEIDILTSRIGIIDEQKKALQSEITNIKTSLSWRLTSPLRKLKKLFR